ncbi:hypothetical protein [Endozoicomonas lisbonensis]|uniref:hypothetical protein n=1 Tax=Endozoicomonas lisbonensis TaxID=3120522 RepID=UPI00339B5B91
MGSSEATQDNAFSGHPYPGGTGSSLLWLIAGGIGTVSASISDGVKSRQNPVQASHIIFLTTLKHCFDRTM